MMICSFKNDYSEGAHPAILNRLIQTNLEQQEGYGLDKYSIEAKELIKDKIDNKGVDIHFVSGGTLANLLVISHILKPYESVIAASSGHIATHEAGAIEATGHKVNAISTKDGKITPNAISTIIETHTDEHMVKPRLVYISNSTELGSVYTKNELETLSNFCKSHNLLLYLDGARLGSALSSDDSDLTLNDISKLADVFYIGATKNGGLIGEAVVFNNNELNQSFRYSMKQKGALMAKSRLISIQFLELFKDDLFFKLAKHSNKMAMKIADAIESLGFSFLTKPSSNQLFPILPNSLIDKLLQNYDFYVWQDTDNSSSAIRIITSWATKEELVDKFIFELTKLSKNHSRL